MLAIPKMKKENKLSSCSGISLKEEKEEFYTEGFIATDHPDKVNDIIPKATLSKIVKQINEITHPDSNTASMHHDRGDTSLVGLGTTAELKPMDNGHWGAFVKTHMNKMHPDFTKSKYEIDNKFVNGFSIEFQDSGSHQEFRDGKEFRILDDINLRGFGFASPRTAVNPEATITDFSEKELVYKEIIKIKEYGSEELVNVPQGGKMADEDKPVEKPAEPVDKPVEEQDKPVEPTEEKPSEEGEKPSEEAKETVTIEKKEFDRLKKIQEEEETKESKKARIVQLKEDLREAIPTMKPHLVPGEGMVVELKEFTEYKETVFSDKPLSIKEQLDVAGSLATKIGAFKRMTTPIEDKEKAWGCKGQKIEYKALETDTNKTSDTDYYQSAAELNDIYDPVIYNVLNDKTTFYGLLNKKDYSQYQSIQTRIKRVRNTSAGAYSEGGAVTKGNQTRLKLQQPFKYYSAGVQVTGQMIASARGAGGIGDVFGQEVSDAASDLLKDINSDLFGIKGAITDEELLGIEYVCDSTNYTTLYGLTRSSYAVPLATGGDDAMSSAAITKKQLRKMIRTVEINGADKSNLLFVCQHTQKDMILGLFDDAQRFNAVSPRAGFEGLPTFDGTPIHADDNCNNDVIFLIDTTHYWIGVQVPPTYEDLAKTDDSRSGFIKTYLNVMCTAPNHCYQADGLATS